MSRKTLSIDYVQVLLLPEFVTPIAGIVVRLKWMDTNERESTLYKVFFLSLFSSFVSYGQFVKAIVYCKQCLSVLKELNAQKRKQANICEKRYLGKSTKCVNFPYSDI